MSITLNDVEVAVLVQVLGGLPLNTFNTPVKMSVLHKLTGGYRVVDTSRCIGSGSGAIFMLENVASDELVNTIKVLRAATGWGLLEAKNAAHAADPSKLGGVIGPFRSSIATFEQLTHNYDGYQSRFPFASSIRMVVV